VDRLNLSPYPHEHAAGIRLTHWGGWVDTIVFTPRPIRAQESNHVPRLETVGGPGRQREIPARRYLGGSEHSAVFLTEFHKGERPLKAAIKLIPAPQENSELQLSRWRLAAELSHPTLDFNLTREVVS